VDKRVKSHELWKEQYQNISEILSLTQKENEILKKKVHGDNFLIIDILSRLVSVIELEAGYPNGYSLQIADHALILAYSLGFNRKEAYDIYIAAMMHNVAVLISSRSVANRIIDELSKEDKDVVHAAPTVAANILNSLPTLEASATLVLSCREKIDGSGYPNRSLGAKIPRGSQLISIVLDYYEILFGYYRLEKVPPEQAANHMRKGRDSAYDRSILDKFLVIMACEYNQASRLEVKCRANMLKPDMVLSRSLTSVGGSVLLPQEHLLTKENIENLQKIEEESVDSFLIFIKKDKL
ncbi:MAG: hypothetical protein HOI53_04070, partial [Francisellaceae bacterium]|nr:hypothetical protein [Francisellaceae bacterium]